MERTNKVNKFAILIFFFSDFLFHFCCFCRLLLKKGDSCWHCWFFSAHLRFAYVSELEMWWMQKSMRIEKKTMTEMTNGMGKISKKWQRSPSAAIGKRSRQWFIELCEDTHRFEENYVFSWCRSRIAEVLRQTQSTSRILKRHFHWLQFVMLWECVCIRDFHSSNQIQRKHSLTKKNSYCWRPTYRTRTLANRKAEKNHPQCVFFHKIHTDLPAKSDTLPFTRRNAIRRSVTKRARDILNKLRQKQCVEM